MTNREKILIRSAATHVSNWVRLRESYSVDWFKTSYTTTEILSQFEGIVMSGFNGRSGKSMEDYNRYIKETIKEWADHLIDEAATPKESHYAYIMKEALDRLKLELSAIWSEGLRA